MGTIITEGLGIGDGIEQTIRSIYNSNSYGIYTKT